MWDTERSLLWVFWVFASLGMGLVAVTPVLSLNGFTQISPWYLLDNHNTLLLFIYSWLGTSRFPGCACRVLLFLVPEGADTGSWDPNLPLCLAAFLTSSLQLLQPKQDDPCCVNRTSQFATKSLGAVLGWSSQPQKALVPLGMCFIPRTSWKHFI